MAKPIRYGLGIEMIGRHARARLEALSAAARTGQKDRLQPVLGAIEYRNSPCTGDLPIILVDSQIPPEISE